MKIIFILRSMANLAGTERVISNKINWLAEKGHKVCLVTYEQGDHPLSFPLADNVGYLDLGTRFFELGFSPLYRRIWDFLKLKKMFYGRLQQIVDEISPDLIITTTYSLNVISEILRIRTEARKIIESHIACFSVSKEYDYRSNFFLKRIGRLYDIKRYSQVDSFDVLYVLTNGDKRDWNCFVKNVKVLPNPLTYYPAQLPDRCLFHRIICVGRLNEQKGFDLLIDAFSRISSNFPEWHVDIYGTGEDKTFLLNMVAEKNLEHQVRICSPTDNIYREYFQSDFYVLSSRYEGYPLVLNEAMSCGTPCVAFRCKYGPEDAIEDGINGLLVKNGDVQDLADKIEWMILHEKERIEMGERARIAAARYKKDQVMREWEQAYLNV